MTVFLETSNIILPNTYLAKVKRKTPVLFAGFFFFYFCIQQFNISQHPVWSVWGHHPLWSVWDHVCMVSMGPRLYGQYGVT